MSKGLSTNQRLTPAQITALKDDGIEFVFRYYAASSTNSKTITAAEAQRLDAAGIAIAIVYEQRGGAGGHPEDFAPALAERDARAALSMAQLINQPAGTAIYFGVDHDFESQHFVETTLVNYFNRIAAVFRQENGGTLPYPLGVYGSGMVCRVLRDRCPDVKYAWLAESTGWTGSAGYNDWDVKQFVNHGEVIGSGAGKLSDFERCRSDDDFGSFRLTGGSVVPSPAKPPVSAEFALELGSAPTLKSGLLTLKDASGGKILQITATSGRKGKQTKSHLWSPGEGPIPDGQPYQLSTRNLFPEEAPFDGQGFQVAPESVQSPGGITRGGFYLHGLESSSGTRGGIAIVEPSALLKVADALAAAAKAGTADIPLTVVYTEAVAPLLPSGGPAAQAIFSLDLRETSTLIDGMLVIQDAAGGELLRVRATSGLAGHQHRGDLWLPNRGPIPDIPDAKTIKTREAWSDVLGWRFFITPETFHSGHHTRGAFRVHKDGGTPGSAGCIVIRDEDDFQGFRDLMKQTVAAEVSEIPLEISYTG
jgi:hypothetical protein